MTQEELLHIVGHSSCSEASNLKLMTSIAWIRCLIAGRSPFELLRQKGINEIIVYGATELGELLVREALKEGYKVSGITDKRVVKGQYCFEGVPILTVDELSCRKETYVVVTAVAFWEEIKTELGERGIHKIIALWDLM